MYLENRKQTNRNAKEEAPLKNVHHLSWLQGLEDEEEAALIARGAFRTGGSDTLTMCLSVKFNRSPRPGGLSGTGDEGRERAREGGRRKMC